MFFVYPAAVSENVDSRYVPAITKTLELYYLSHIVSAIAGGFLTFFVVQRKRGGPYSEIRVESMDLEGNVLLEARSRAEIEAEIGATTDEIKRITGLVAIASTPTENQSAEAQLLSAKERLKALHSELKDVYKDKEPAKKQAVDVKLDTETALDIRPSIATIGVRMKRVDVDGNETLDSDATKIPIGVKIVPIYIKKFDNIYKILQDDYYANAFSFIIKRLLRTSSFTRPAALTALKLYHWAMSQIGAPIEDFNIWKDLLLGKKGFVNASSFKQRRRSPKHQRFASAVVIMSENDIDLPQKNFFAEPGKVSRLFKLGWNSFVVMQDSVQTATFCSYLEGGMCTKIPYHYLYKSLGADKLFTELDNLKTYVGRVVGKFKRIRFTKVFEAAERNISAMDNADSKYKMFMEAADGQHPRSNN